MRTTRGRRSPCDPAGAPPRRRTTKGTAAPRCPPQCSVFAAASRQLLLPAPPVATRQQRSARPPDPGSTAYGCQRRYLSLISAPAVAELTLRNRPGWNCLDSIRAKAGRDLKRDGEERNIGYIFPIRIGWERLRWEEMVWMLGGAMLRSAVEPPPQTPAHGAAAEGGQRAGSGAPACPL